MRGKLLLVAILLIAGFFRFYNPNWDAGHHLHPDERFLTMVGNAMNLQFIQRLPATDESGATVYELHTNWDMLLPAVVSYFNPAQSTLNPNNIGFPFYVYGSFPLVLNKFVAVLVNADSYADYTILGRVLSATSDMVTLLFVFAFAKLWEKKFNLHFGIKYAAAFLYALMALPIQLSHFFAADTFLVTFMTGTAYFCAAYAFSLRRRDALLAGIFFGLALACKVSAVWIIPPAAGFIAIAFCTSKLSIKKRLIRFLAGGTIIAASSYISLRLANPPYFASASWFDPRLNERFTKAVTELQNMTTPDSWFPPMVQWLNKPPVFFSLSNMILLGIGVAVFFFIIVGSITAFRYKKAHVRWYLAVLLIWIFVNFFYQSTHIVKVMRYFIQLYPFLAFIGGFGLTSVLIYLNRTLRTQYLKAGAMATIVLLLFIWPLMFLSIYVQPHTRVVASYWIHDHLDPQKLILFEHWDDPLPLPIVHPKQQIFRGEELPVFGPDDEAKWQQMNDKLARGGYYILSSNRGWGSIPTVPDRYPRMTTFYEDVFAGRTQYRKIADFTSYPSLEYLGISLTLPTDWADESFTVYDHPRVMIFMKVDQ